MDPIEEAGMNGTIICGIDDSTSAREAAIVARHLADTLGLGLTYVRVESEHPADGLVRAATDAQAALLVVGSTGPRSSLLGSVSADVSRRAPCPVVVVPPAAGRRLVAQESRGAIAGGVARFHLGAVTAGSGPA
jgi:nucleotide-binding universal stress UspA family protein